MAIKLSGALKAAEERTSFDIIFNDATTYNLDDLVAARDRLDSTKELVIEVKESGFDNEISAKVLERLKVDLRDIIITNLNDLTVRDRIDSIVRAVYTKYFYSDYPNPEGDDIYTRLASKKNVPAKVYEEINFEVTKLFKELLEENQNLSYEVSFGAAPKVIIIDYRFKGDEDLTDTFVAYYLKYAHEYETEFKKVDEGGLAIVNEGERRLVVTETDYSKYLLEDEEEQPTIERSPSAKSTTTGGLSTKEIKQLIEDAKDDIFNKIELEKCACDTETKIVDLGNGRYGFIYSTETHPGISIDPADEGRYFVDYNENKDMIFESEDGRIEVFYR